MTGMELINCRSSNSAEMDIVAAGRPNGKLAIKGQMGNLNKAAPD